MSVYSNKTGITSILKAYSPKEREKEKAMMINKVRFALPKERGLIKTVEIALGSGNFQVINEFVDFIQGSDLNDEEMLVLMQSAQKLVNDLGSTFTNLVESLLSLAWTKRSPECVTAYTEFFIDIVVAYNKYLHFGIPRLISLWVPSDHKECDWPYGTPNAILKQELHAVHKLLDKILTAVPLAFDVVWETIEGKFPYYKKPSYCIAGYLHNVLWLTEYKPMFTELVVQLVLQKMLLLDVNAPRTEIEEIDGDNDNDDEKMEDDIFIMDDESKKESVILTMKHSIANTLDLCMNKLYQYLEEKNPNAPNLNDEAKFNKQLDANKFFQIMLRVFDETLLPTHNTHHVQFLIFYFCSFKTSYAEMFLSSLWDKVQNPNVSAIIRQTAIGYLASFIARSKFLHIDTIRHYLKELCNWAHQYNERCDQSRFNASLKANLVFYTVCQAIFYVIAFRSRDLTTDKKSLMFLQALQLSTLVTCNFNPLRVCVPAVATTFAGVTRTYQLAYCHAILERNARRKLATVYANDVAKPEEALETFFPFDPYLLKMSLKYIEPNYMRYQASDAEEQPHVKARKRGDSEMNEDVDIDDFLIADKRQKVQNVARSQDREIQFTYGLSPGFHM